MPLHKLNAITLFLGAALFAAFATLSDALQIDGSADIFDIPFFFFVGGFCVMLWRALSEWSEEA